MTKLFYDCEFLEDGETIELISIGLVAEDGREYYAVNRDAPWRRILRHDWLVANVVPSLPVIRHDGIRPFRRPFLDRAHPDVKSSTLIATHVRQFIQATPDVELWAWYGAYDHVVLCQLWGRMIDLPDGVPMWTNDLKQEAVRLGNPPLPDQANGLHNALADARHLKVMAEHLAERSDWMRDTPDGQLAIVRLACGHAKIVLANVGVPGPGSSTWCDQCGEAVGALRYIARGEP